MSVDHQSDITSKKSNFRKQMSANDENLVRCILCADKFNPVLYLPVLMRHLFDVHHIIVEDMQNIPDLPAYLDEWRRKCTETEIERIVPAVAIDSTNVKYFVISSLINEDKALRHRLRLNDMLKVQERERDDANYEEKCLFCKYKHKGTRHDYIKHLSDEHNLQIGHPHNLVYIDALVAKLRAQLAALTCIYCRKRFPDRATLKEHMRKKQHKSVDPRDHSYDRYYSVNYLDPDRAWTKSDDLEPDPVAIGQDCDREYDDWNESDLAIACLFCAHNTTNIAALAEHMLAEHRFNFYLSTCSLDFYQRVKLVNYMRRQVDRAHCAYCDRGFDDCAQMLAHVGGECNCQLPPTDVFDQPEFYFPTHENDTFLLFLEEIED